MGHAATSLRKRRPEGSCLRVIQLGKLVMGLAEGVEARDDRGYFGWKQVFQAGVGKRPENW